jgi:hypothetical protein
MMFDGRSITLNANHTFTYDIMKGLSGLWKINEETVILESSELPDQIILTDVRKDSCMWNFQAMNTKITFYKNLESKVLNETIGLENVKKEDLVGEWINTLIEDVNNTKEDNIHIFGSGNENKLILNKSGQFSLSKSTYNTLTGRILEGSTGSVDNGVILFEDELGKTESLGVIKINEDSFPIFFENKKSATC